MIGDGINDAPALASADIGISMGISGSALATETGNIILMSNDIRKIPEAIKLARKTRWKVLENIILSITTKAAIIGLAIGGYPFVWAAVVADVGTCLLVILNSMLLLPRGHKHGGKFCRSSSKSHNHKGCGGSHDHDHAHRQHQRCHDHEHEHDHHHYQQKHEHDHHQHEHKHDHHHCEDEHEHDHHHHQHEHDHHHHHIHKTENMSQPQKCGGSHVNSSHHHHHHLQHQHEHEHDEHHHHNQHEHHSCNQHDHQNHSHVPLDQHQHPHKFVNHCNTMNGHDLFKRSDEFHEHDHCHYGRCDKNQDGVQKHEMENSGGSNSRSLILNAEDAVVTNRHGNCSGHKTHGTKHCHNQHVDRVAHDGVSHSSPYHPPLSCQKESQGHTNNHCHPICGCESLKDMHHKKSGCSPDIEKNGTGEISVDIIEHVELTPLHGCSSLAEKEKGSCEGCSDTCENLAAACGCEGSKEGEDSACCENECSSKECKESSIVHVCVGWEKREFGGCCKSYMKECCGKLGQSRAGFVGGMSEIMTE